MTSREIRQQIELPDGRRLGYVGYGARDGVLVLPFHGFPGSRLDYPLFDDGDVASKTNGRIIAVDRPGMGLFDFQRGRTILDWPVDTTGLADAI